MKFVNWITVPLITCACWSAVIGCSDDEPANSGGSGGKAGAGGSSGRSGTGGKGGTGGSAGSAGSDAAAESGNDGDTGTDGGDAGVAKQCVEECSHDDDCAIPGSDAGTSNYVCREKRCADPLEYCAADADCLAFGSQWKQACDAGNPCPQAQQVCVNIGGGQGRCARRAWLPDAGPDGGSQCNFIVPDLISIPALDDSGAVEVCGHKSNSSCNLETKVCYLRCESSDECVFPGAGSSCDTLTGRCRCVKDGDCNAPGVSKCNLTTGRCECASDDDCKAVTEHKACVSGQCGCSNASACTKTFSGTTETCK
jgi:hypothetical protein